MSNVLTVTEPVSEPAKASEKTTESGKAQGNIKSRLFSLSKTQILILLGTALFVVSHMFLWWELRLNAPQFPGGLFIQATSYEIQDSPKTPFNDIREVDGLNHYIGMMSLGDAAQIEMMLAIPAIVVFTILGITAVLLLHKGKKWAPILTIPIILFPWVYLADLYFWLRYAGQNLDPMAAITLPPFIPKVWGTGEIMQFSTVAQFQVGWYIAVAAGIVCIAAIIVNRRGKSEQT